MADKDFKTIDEQLDLLISRGLSISDRQSAARFLLMNNYYRVSGYTLTLRNHDTFFPNTKFQNIVDIYEFDHRLRHIVLKYIEVIETSLKSSFAYFFTEKHGPSAYLDPACFTDAKKHEKILSKAEEQKKARHFHEAYLKHFMDELHQDIPLWAYVDLFTISDISILYSISEADIQRKIALSFGLSTNKGSVLLGKFMHSMTIIRNLCAHGSRLFNRLFEQKPSLNRQEKGLLIVHQDGTVDNAHLYGFILIMRRLLPTRSFSNMKAELMKLTEQFPFVSMRYYGFRDDWKNIL